MNDVVWIVIGMTMSSKPYAGTQSVTRALTILNAFSDCRGPDVKKYVAAPCSNCKGQMRDLIEHYKLREKEGITYAGLVELMVNAMVDVKPGFIKWDDAM